MSINSKPCGIYKTTRTLQPPLQAALLVYFHNHSESGGPVVHLPASNSNNRWRFESSAHSISSGDADSLRSLKAQGLYRLREHFHPDKERIVAANSLVQLGYNREAEPIVFFPVSASGASQLEFPSRGMIIPPEVYELLEPLDLRGPYKPTTVH